MWEEDLCGNVHFGRFRGEIVGRGRKDVVYAVWWGVVLLGCAADVAFGGPNV